MRWISPKRLQSFRSWIYCKYDHQMMADNCFTVRVEGTRILGFEIEILSWPNPYGWAKPSAKAKAEVVAQFGL
jgi:hypothetical protein